MLMGQAQALDEVEKTARKSVLKKLQRHKQEMELLVVVWYNEWYSRHAKMKFLASLKVLKYYNMKRR